MKNVSIPKIDQLAGIQCYCTHFNGVRGLIKQNNEGFRVSEIIDESFLNNLSSIWDTHHRFPLYILNTRSIDSNHALFEIKKELGIRLKVIGIKDAKAVTRQYATSEQTKNIPREAKTQHTLLTLKGFTKIPLRKSFLHGNEFKIDINNPKFSDISDFVPELKNIANFYGLQRFGSKRMITHLVGREIVKRNFKNAVELLLSYSTEYDSSISREVREKCRDPKNYSQVLKQLPKGMDIEYQVMSTLVKGEGYIAALRSIPITIRRLFVQAYQAYLFNKCLSIAILSGENVLKGKEADLCFEMASPIIFGRIRRLNPNLDLDSKKIVPAIMLVGYAFQPGKGRFELITQKIMQEEFISAKDFYIQEMQELSAQGGFRQAPLCCRDFSYADSLTLCFKLPKGSYATTLLRDLMKPEDPIRSGF
ncbi:MAG TPA: tRNA pseudouridine(13) synthase TruD [Nitrososphaeraceae archaeon]|nr:tRNA pseudouridine(13) synthase TruD [Nitrososphaeraceae archaeon]